MEKYDVVIPALNEQETIGQIVYQFTRHLRIGNVYVMVDVTTTDQTEAVARSAGALAIWRHGMHGKGEMVQWALHNLVITPRVILCDADYIRFNQHHITMAAPPYTADSPLFMRIVVPRIPTRKEWEESGFPVPLTETAWSWNSGFRSFPVELAEDLELHGYLTETQLNKAAKEKKYLTELMYESSLYSPLRFNRERMEAMDKDRQWGLENGVFDD